MTKLLIAVAIGAAALNLSTSAPAPPKLREARLTGIRAFRGFAASYVQKFDTKWLGTIAPDEPLLGTADIQSLADLAKSAAIVRNMRTVPVSRQFLST